MCIIVNSNEFTESWCLLLIRLVKDEVRDELIIYVDIVQLSVNRLENALIVPYIAFKGFLMNLCKQINEQFHYVDTYD